MTESLDLLEREARSDLEASADESALSAWRAAYLGRKGEVTEAVRALGGLSPQERPAYGQRVRQ